MTHSEHAPTDLPDWVTGTTPPWWLLRAGRVPDAALRQARRHRLRVVTLAGGRAPEARSLFAELAGALEFPDYFGHNWSAVEDCLIDLAWLPAPGYLLVVEDAGRLLDCEPAPVLGLFLDLLSRVGRHWATPIALGEPWDRPAVPFHAVLHCADAVEVGRFADRAARGGADAPT
jgi:hypothetical protein